MTITEKLSQKKWTLESDTVKDSESSAVHYHLQLVIAAQIIKKKEKTKMKLEKLKTLPIQEENQHVLKRSIN